VKVEIAVDLNGVGLQELPELVVVTHVVAVAAGVAKPQQKFAGALPDIYPSTRDAQGRASVSEVATMPVPPVDRPELPGQPDRTAPSAASVADAKAVPDLACIRFTSILVSRALFLAI